MGGPHRGHEAWMHGVGPDAVRPIFHRRRFGENAHRALGGVIGGMAPFPPDEAHDGRDVHDRATPGALHGRNGILRPQEDPRGIDVHNPPPPLGIHRISHRRAAEPGIIHQNIQLAAAGDRGLDDLAPVLLLGHIGTHEQGRAAGGCDLGGEARPLLLEHIGDDDLGALACEQPCLFSTHAVGRSAHDSHLAC